MMHALFSALALAAAPAFSPVPGGPTEQGGADVTTPDLYVAGTPFQVQLTFHGGEAGTELEAWQLGPAAFEVDGQPLGSREGGAKISLPAGAELTLSFDLGPALPTSGSFQLATLGGEAKSVRALAPAPAGLDFMKMEPAELAKYQVLIQTNRGNMLAEFLPQVAPNHVRNFLDLCASGFYEGTLFHRVSPTFMIQGGDPNTKTDRRSTWGQGRGPRMLDAEFNDTKHVRGVLSMARGPSPNSASSQFFVISKDSTFLDHQYSAFGRLLSGFDTLDRIASAEGRKGRDGTVMPSSPQRIERTIVLLADPAKDPK